MFSESDKPPSRGFNPHCSVNPWLAGGFNPHLSVNIGGGLKKCTSPNLSGPSNFREDPSLSVLTFTLFLVDLRL